MGRSTNYSNAYIYHIVDKDGIVHYVGSTSNFNSRKSKHKYTCNHENSPQYHFDIYKYIRENGGFEQFEIIPIRKIENVSNKTELCIAENDEIKKFSGLKNMRGSYLSPEKRYELNRQYHENNPEKNALYCKKYRESNIEKFRELQRNWEKKNHEKRAEYKRQWQKKNSEKVKEYQRKKYQEKKQLNASDQ